MLIRLSQPQAKEYWLGLKELLRPLPATTAVRFMQWRYISSANN